MAGMIVPAHSDHIFWIANNMREADRNECAAGGRGPYAALRDSLERSISAWTGMVGDSEPVCMFGVAPLDLLGSTGSPWLLGTDAVQKYAVTFLKLNKVYISKMLDIFPHLLNYVDARHVAAIRWLTWLGFKFDREAVPFGPFNLPFFRFEMRR